MRILCFVGQFVKLTCNVHALYACFPGILGFSLREVARLGIWSSGSHVKSATFTKLKSTEFCKTFARLEFCYSRYAGHNTVRNLFVLFPHHAHC